MEVLNGDALKDYFPSSSKFKWKIEKVSELNQDDHFSPTFFVGHCKWYMNQLCDQTPNFLHYYVLRTFSAWMDTNLDTVLGRRLLAFLDELPIISTTITKLMLENNIVRLVKSGKKNEDLILFAEHIKSRVQKTPIAEGLPRLARWNLIDISSAIQTDFGKQILNGLRTRQQKPQDQSLLCEAEQSQPQQNEFVMQEEVRSLTVQGDEGVGNVGHEELLILQNNYDDLRMLIKKSWDKKEMKKSNGKTVHYEVEELLNELYFKAYPDEKKKKRKEKKNELLLVSRKKKLLWTI
ncbi:hypothetical protein MKW98_016720 [Papaver atlanticum]|uniref:Uncharacterized protein n=1 Tax=Papaver atlanticum TaxID=357466 RepID=A0AAD4XIZ6_9MAGN|nr:hypothetical protein MKW98_016720 [Papaver atlanticum]